MRLVTSALLALVICWGAPVFATQPQDAEAKENAAPAPYPTPAPDTPEGRLHKLASYYWNLIAKAAKRETSYNRGRTNVEKFDTDAGPLLFTSSQIKIKRVEGVPYGVAWVRIGKTESVENGAAIRSFLSSSRQSKLDAGFTLVEKKETPSDYGSIVTSLSKRGDEYFKTYLQTVRNQSPTAEHSTYLTYTYYIEMGLTSRKEMADKQQSTKKLGE